MCKNKDFLVGKLSLIASRANAQMEQNGCNDLYDSGMQVPETKCSLKGMEIVNPIQCKPAQCTPLSLIIH